MPAAANEMPIFLDSCGKLYFGRDRTVIDLVPDTRPLVEDSWQEA